MDNMLSYEELFILYNGLQQLIDNVKQAKKLVYDEESRKTLDKELVMYEKLKSKLMEHL